MRLLIQRVSSATITIDSSPAWSIQDGIVCYIGISRDFDHTRPETITKAVNKLLNVRLWENEEWKLKRSIQDINASILIVSNFTLRGQMKKWTQLDFGKSGKYNDAQKIYDQFVALVAEQYGADKVLTGKFGAMMEVESVNSGPVNIIIDL